MGNRYVIDWKAYAGTAVKAAAEGAVLLKNDKKALPLQEGMKLAVFGRIQFDYYKSGTGSGGMINTKYVVGILDALKEENLKSIRNWNRYTETGSWNIPMISEADGRRSRGASRRCR